MQIPSSAAFSPLPELIAEFGIPDPFEILRAQRRARRIDGLFR